MNGKQARMLRQMRASKKDRIQWTKLSADNRGILRCFHENNPKMIHFTFPYACEITGITS